MYAKIVSKYSPSNRVNVHISNNTVVNRSKLQNRKILILFLANFSVFCLFIKCIVTHEFSKEIRSLSFFCTYIT